MTDQLILAGTRRDERWYQRPDGWCYRVIHDDFGNEIPRDKTMRWPRSYVDKLASDRTSYVRPNAQGVLPI